MCMIQYLITTSNVTRTLLAMVNLLGTMKKTRMDAVRTQEALGAV